MRTLIKNGYVVDPASNREGRYDILVEGTKIVDVAEKINEVADNVINAEGCHIYPGFIDMHVHLREPGYEYKETVKTGTAAAAAGGYTTICVMPNTKPSTDSPEHVEELNRIIERDAVVKVLPIGAVTIGQQGQELTDIEGMMKAGICGISEDGKSVMDISLYREAMKKATQQGTLVMAHCEDRELLYGGVMNAGKYADRLDLPGISNTVEDHITVRDILLAGELGTRLHICHVSTKLSAEFVRMAKKQGFNVTAEVCPHHFSLSDADIPCDDANYKMNPPLRSKEDVEAMIAALKDGTMDVISTDHAPHAEDEKAKGFAKAPFGIVGLETAYGLSVTKLVKTGILSYSELIYKMSARPAEILGLDKKDGRGSLKVGAVADLVIANPDEKWIVDSAQFKSKGKNTPFNGEFLQGQVKLTMVNGEFIK